MNATAANYDLDGNVAAAASKSSDDDVVTEILAALISP